MWILYSVAKANIEHVTPRSKMALRLVTTPVGMTDIGAFHFNVKTEAADLGSPSYFVSWQKTFMLLPSLRWNKHADLNELHCPGPVLDGQGIQRVSMVGGGASATPQEHARLQWRLFPRAETARHPERVGHRAPHVPEGALG